MKSMLIFNPAAGARKVKRELEQVIAYWEGRGWQVIFRETQGAGDATAFAREAVATCCHAVFVAAGDGTVGEAADGLAGSEVALGVLPAGAGNVWALELGIPTPAPLRRHPLLDAAEILAEGETWRIDLGRAGQRHFILWAGIGLDARVAQRMEHPARPAKRLGTLVYAAATALVAKDFRGARMRITVDGHEMNTQAILVVVGNAQLYARILRIAADAYVDDGLLDVCIFRGGSFASTVQHVVRALLHRHLRAPQVEYYQCRKVSISSDTRLSVQADGDPIGVTPMEFEIVPQALNVIVPPSSSKKLFCRAQ